MVKFRKDNPVLVYGDYELLVRPEHEQVYAYTRTLGDVKMLVLLNFSDDTAGIELPEGTATDEVLINNYDAVETAVVLL